MRISDWSSDVCSSDLFGRRQERPFDKLRANGVGGRSREASDLQRRRPAAFDPRPRADRLAGRPRALGDAGGARGPQADRKRVVSGKTGSVRVDLGGRCILTKKKYK